MSDDVVTGRDKGEVKFFNSLKGFGFCRRDGRRDVFLHINELRRSGINEEVKPGDVLEFDVVAVPLKGPKAANVKVLSKAPVNA